MYFVVVVALVAFYSAAILSIPSASSITTTTWDFSSSADFIFDSKKVSIDASSSSLRLVDQTDDDNTIYGFGGGVHDNTQFDTDHIEMDATGLTNGTSTFTSRIMDVGTSATWTTMTPTPAGPYGKALPNTSTIETEYSELNADMSNNILLLHFDETEGDVADSSINSATGSYSGTDYDEGGVFGGALLFDGTDDRVIVEQFDTTGGLGAMTIEGWFKFTSVNASDVLVAQWNNGVNHRFSFQTHSVADELIVYIPNAPTGSNATWNTTGADLTADQWYHIAFVWDGSQGTEVAKGKFYVDGSQVASGHAGTTGITTLTNSSGLDLRVADMENFGPREMPATIDEIAIYDTALSAATILEHYKRGALNIKYQVRTCDDDACSGENFVGPGGSTTAYFTEASNTSTTLPSFALSGVVSNNQYIQYRALLHSSSTAYTPELDAMSFTPSHRWGDSPTTTPVTSTGAAFGGTPTSFTASEGGTGDVFYQITNRGDQENPTWYYWDGGNWSSAGATDYSSSSTVNANIASFSLRGTFAWRAFFESDAAETVILSEVVFGRETATIASSGGSDIFTTSTLIIDSDYFNFYDDDLKSIVDWRVASTSIAALNLPFEAHSNTSTTAVDYSQNSNDATLVNDPEFATSTGYDSDGAYTFSDSDKDYMTVADAASLQLTDNFTVTAWVRRSAVNAYDGLVNKVVFNGGTTNGWSLHFNPNYDSVGVYLACNGADDYVMANTGVASSTDFSWHHYAVRMTSGTTDLFVDGQKQLDHSTQPVCDSGGAMTIGRFYSDVDAHYTDGIIDEVALWNRSLSTAYIEQLAASTTDRIPPGEAIVGDSWSAQIVQNDNTEDLSTETTNPLVITQRANTIPVITTTTPASDYYWVKSGLTLPMSIGCDDEDGDTISYSWTVDGTSVASTADFNYVAADYSEAQHTVVATCDDGNAHTTSTTFTVETLPSDAFTILVPTNLARGAAQYKAIIKNQTNWIVELNSYLNLKYVAYPGDIAEDGSDTAEWEVLQEGLAPLLTHDIPHDNSIGNHDYDDNLVQDNTGNRDIDNWETYFPLASYSAKSWWGGQETAGVHKNTYQLFSANNVDYIVLNLEFCPSDTTLSWASGILDTYSTRTAIVVTHLNIEGDDTYVVSGEDLACDLFLSSAYELDTDKNNGDDLWDEFVEENETIVAVISGHMIGDGHGFRQDTGTNNNVVSQYFHNDYSSLTGQLDNNSYVGMLIFKPSSNVVSVQDYDPYYDTLDSGADNEYTFDVGSSSTPTGLTTVANNQSQVRLSWSGGSNASTNEYLVENTTNGTNSGWLSSVSYTDTSVQCSQNYSYRVKTRNAAMHYNTAFSASLSVLTEPWCDGGSHSSGSAPAVKSGKQAVRINTGEVFTNDKNVLLSFFAEDVSLVAISHRSDFKNAAFRPYEEKIPWVLSEGDGKKTVYVRLRSSAGVNLNATASIILRGQGFKQTESGEHDTVDASQNDTSTPLGTCPLQKNTPYKHNGSSSVWYVSNTCEKLAFTNQSRYFTYFRSWDAVQTTSQSLLNQIPDDPLGFMPWGPLWSPQSGTLAKSPYDPRVYFVAEGQKRWIASEEVYNALYGVDKMSWIEDVHVDFLDRYENGGDLTDPTHRPNYTLIKYPDNPKVYRLEPAPEDASKQVKRHILNKDVFTQFGYRWDRIVVIQNDEVYEDGGDLG